MISADHLDTDILTFLKRHENKQLLRFVTVGSVDDGKSTLIGRLLYDTGGVYEDQLADARSGPDGTLDLARITDGLSAEREQGITIDVAYRYFTTRTRKFIIADTPGHIQYTRNMATGASTADVAITLIDARYGVLQQSRRHAYIASLLGIPYLTVAINKMDLKDWDQRSYEQIRDDFLAFAGDLGFKEVKCVPVSALLGDNIVARSENMPWYQGPSILEYLEQVEVGSDRNFDNFRLPVQTVIRPNLDYRGYAGQIASGIIRPGDAVRVLPSGETSHVASIDTMDGPLDMAFAPQSITLRLADEIDCSRGDILCKVGDEARVARSFEAMVVWMNDQPLDLEKTYLIKHATRYVRVNFASLNWKADLETLEHTPANELAINEIGNLTLTTHRPLVFDDYKTNRAMGAFIVIDSLTNDTVGAGMIQPAQDESAKRGLIELDAAPRTGISTRERSMRLGQRGGTVWITGLPGSGKSTLAYALERRLFDLGYLPMVLDASDGDDELLPPVTAPDETLHAAKRFAAAGLVTIAAYTSPTAQDRERARAAVGGDHFLEVWVSTPESVCREWDLRDRYAASDAGERSPAPLDYEAPENADVELSMDDMDLEDAVEKLIAAMRESGMLLGT